MAEARFPSLPEKGRFGSVLVTGASGFIGSHLVRHLVACAAEVHGVARRPPETTVAGVAWVQGDVRDEDFLRRLCDATEPEIVFHLAANNSVRLVDAELRGVVASVEENVLPALRLATTLNRMPSVKRLVRLGGMEEYGPGETPYSEAQREHPVSPYSASQVAVTHYLQMMQPHLSFEVVTLRPALIYGPGQSPRFVIPALIAAASRGEPFVMGTTNARRDLLFIDDLIAALLASADAPGLGGRVLNVGSDEACEMHAVAELVLELMGNPISVTYDGARNRSTEITDLRGDSSQAKAALGWGPEVSLRDGLRRTIDSYAGGR